MRKLLAFLAAALFATGAAAQWPGYTQKNAPLAGPFLVGSGTAAAPSYSFSAFPGSGFAIDFANVGYWSQSGTATIAFGNSVGLVASADRGYNWYTAVGTGTYAQQAGIVFDAANTLAERNGISPQTFRIYNTFTDSNNKEYAELVWSVNQFYLQTNGLGTGVSQPLNIRTVGASALSLGTNSTARVTIPATQNAIRFTSFTFANIATNLTTNGDIGYCADCTIANPCAGVGTGALAKRLNGINVCN